ncbi:hypothetical protein FHT87_005173 [Rhizobium sp. BK316]|uniref:hypothetical protein n=1 Tax=Rhizobium sp. BK316 TaxID=2587053 RepID=UPI00161B0285|nr:hypothetical protein [Rhizobium sp. BK316]MBB3411220.1 hypothetical protein [Rhizobium sp. BK316]
MAKTANDNPKKISMAEENDLLNNLMEEAFGCRPLFLGMRMDEAHAWMTKLHRHWIERSRDSALTRG